jgi:hypothetical protein
MKKLIGLACGIKDLILYRTQNPPLLNKYPFYIVGFKIVKEERYAVISYANTGEVFLYPFKKLKITK